MSTSVNSVQPETRVNDNACIYNIHPPSLLYFSILQQGIPIVSVEFVGYLLLATQPSPALYPLYCPPAGLDHVGGFIYLKLELSLFAYLRAPMVHSMAYESPSIEVPVFILALPEIMPFLNLPWIRSRSTSDDSDMIYGVYDCAGVAHAHEPETIIHFTEYPYGHYLPLLQDDNQSVDGSSILQTTWIGSSAMASVTGTTIHPPRKKRELAEHSLHKIMETCPNWQRTVLTKDTKVLMLENAVVMLALPWITQFLYDNRRVVTHSMDDSRIFGLGNFFGLAQRHCIVTLLQMFTRPYAHLLPLCMTYFVQQANAFVKFLRHQMAKELIYHIVFRTTATCCVRLTITDLEPTTFRNATNPPVDTLALMGSCCYQVLLARLVLIWGTIDPMPDYPTPSQVHAELRETAMMLIQQVEDLQFINFMGQLRELCTITEADLFLRMLAIILWLCKHPTIVSPFLSIYDTSSNTHFLGTERTETALISWLQERGRDILPASLYITASVLFGWVDTHDLIALLDMSLREVSMQAQLQQEEERSCAAFCSRGGNAIANLSEELEIRFSIGSNKPGSTVKDLTYVGACLAPSSIMFNQFRPTQATRDKCNTWLNTSSHFQDVMGPDSHANRTLFGSPQILDDDPYLCESFQGTWVDNLTYHAYMSASFAESGSLRINTSDDFKPMESKTMDILRSDIHILGLKKQCAQAEVDMFSEALARIAEFEGTDHDAVRSSYMTAGSV
ncbi:hypothetical protein DFH29DRAFT_878524 [Suillus ampliporus]|nr:hypothetical protein DFH29DRAFT_878524 [Suillus ampliporus]